MEAELLDTENGDREKESIGKNVIDGIDVANPSKCKESRRY